MLQDVHQRLRREDDRKVRKSYLTTSTTTGKVRRKVRALLLELEEGEGVASGSSAVEDEIEVINEDLGRGKRIKRVPAHFDEFEIN